MESDFQVSIGARGSKINLEGFDQNIKLAKQLLADMEDHLAKNKQLKEVDFQTYKRLVLAETGVESDQKVTDLHSRSGLVKARTKNQDILIQSMQKNDIVFSIGPAGTGKTYLSVAKAANHLRQKNIRKIVLVRPIVQAGEDLGYLPGDFREKVNPYLRPLFDALDDFFTKEELKSFYEQDIIEVAPLAYMRGRTLNQAFVILDEAQNATVSQMKMFLTRIGQSSKCIINGDKTQIDLPKRSLSGLIHAEKILSEIKGIDFVYFDKGDVIRHRLIADIIHAYESDN
ncbi:MAG: PhoH family protein [Calditrichaeota bacterium]|nr:PhoH family protein [Calditrichota bacterium]